MKKILLSPIWSILVLGLLAYIYSSNPNFLESIKLRYFDQLIINQEPVQNSIYTVNIDETSLEVHGQWPWPRADYAAIIEDLYNKNAGLVVFMVFMAEEDRAGQDRILSETMKQYPVVLNMLGAEENKNEPINPGASIINSDYMHLIPSVPGIIANVPDIEGSAIGSGIVNTFPEIDGVTRRVPLVFYSGDTIYPNVTMEVLRVIAGDPSFQIKLSPLGVDKLRVPQFGVIPTDELGRVWIDWSQKSTSVSLEDLPEDFGGAVVFVTPTAAGLNNPIATAAGGVYPHELQAALLGTVFNQTNIERPAWATGAELLYLLLAGIALIGFAYWTYIGIGFFVLSASTTVIGSMYLFSTYNWLVDGVVITAMLLVVGLVRYAVKFVKEFLQKQQIKKQFGGYVSPLIVNQLAKDPSIVEKGMRRNISIVMTDLRGFTPLGESYGDDVEGLRQIMNDYMHAISQPVLNNNGTIIKYIGDATLHIHGAPLEDKNHELNAVRTALEMINAVELFNEELKAKGKPPVGMGAGVNTGPTVIGNIGSKQRFGYDVLGDSVSTAARLEGQSKPYGVKIVIGPETAERIKHHMSVVELDWIAVKGKTQALTIYTVLKEPVAPAEFWYYHGEYLKDYRAGNWKDAVEKIEFLEKSASEDLQDYYKMMKERINELANENVQNFDGVYRATSK